MQQFPPTIEHRHSRSNRNKKSSMTKAPEWEGGGWRMAIHFGRKNAASRTAELTHESRIHARTNFFQSLFVYAHCSRKNSKHGTNTLIESNIGGASENNCNQNTEQYQCSPGNEVACPVRSVRVALLAVRKEIAGLQRPLTKLLLVAGLLVDVLGYTSRPHQLLNEVSS